AAREVLEIFESTPGVVDVDWTIEDPQQVRRFAVDRSTAARAGASVEQITQTLYLALSGHSAGIAPSTDAREGTPIIPRLPVEHRASVEALLALPVATATGPQPLGRFVRVEEGVRESSRVRKNLRPAIYVTGDVAGEIESPVYAILDMNRKLDAVRIAGVVLLIYALVVGWFQSFRVPLVIMAPIPLTLIGILPGHAISGAFFTATSMIGMIALAGIIVRNSILLVDFIQLAQARGRPLA